MDRTNRLLAIVLELQARRRVRAEDLAATFEVSTRTIYRDMLALDEAGIPIVAVPGQGYSLVEGYFLPPLSFTTDEALMLLLGSDVVAQQFDSHERREAQSARQKIKAVLPERLRGEAEYLEKSIQFVSFSGPSAPQTLQRVRQAIVERRTVRFRYHARYRDAQTEAAREREADPYALLHIGGAWMLVAYCHTRRDTRHFRLSRMEDVVLLDALFVRPPDFAVTYGDEDDRTVVVRAVFDHEAAQRVLEAPSLFQVAQEQRPDGLLVTFTVRQPGDLLGWLLAWGSHVRVLEPQSLRDLLAHEARVMLDNHAGHAKPDGAP